MREFVVSKAKNFREMLRPFCITPDQREFLEKYDETHIDELVNTYLYPLYQTGTLHIARDMIVSQLNITDKKVSEKIDRYLECFTECLLG